MSESPVPQEFMHQQRQYVGLQSRVARLMRVINNATGRMDDAIDAGTLDKTAGLKKTIAIGRLGNKLTNYYYSGVAMMNTPESKSVTRHTSNLQKKTATEAIKAAKVQLKSL
mgnify:CR=1 FL=1